MKLRQKIIIFATVPLILALCIIAYAVYHHATELAKAQQEVIRQTYLASKEMELRSYVMLARHSIAHIYESGRKDAAAMDDAKAILARLDYGSDGYFFVYDLEGKLLVHPRRPHLIGLNRWDYKDLNGFPTIQQLISRARQGGGFVTYSTEKPSTRKPAVKLTHVIPLSDWGWVLGSGIYLDDVDEVLTNVEAQVWSNNFDTMRWIGVIAFLGVIVVIASGLVLNIRERRAAQAEERARVAGELHDDICQRLISARLQTETGIIQLTGMPEQFTPAQSTFERMAAELNNILGDIRKIAHDLYPGTIGSGPGLTTSLRQLAHDMENIAASVEFTAGGDTDGLSGSVNKVLYRVAQEALKNVMKHAAASQASMRLEGGKHRVTLTIRDNGTGFDAGRIDSDPRFGMGLRNMKKRLGEVGGHLQINSTSSGTTVIATIPLSLLHYFLPRLP
ncbi:histidine kinase [Nitrosospira lacus]|uniref:histidine kinase n=1 Tax=Nitrosospira lacus TaxID=1288494 RepID=A0A1W6SPQ9_9PROT|nr:cache domain-containing protein [Nitrosospira lacus]ARO87777.1 histidine kinase [Nitrosospira lacus]